LLVSYDDTQEKLCRTSNVAMACYTTAFARLKLNELLQTLQKRCLYFDTDSVYYLIDGADATQNSLTEGIFLGDLSNELECYGKNAYISELICGGPKNYFYVVKNEAGDTIKTVSKVKGITLDYLNQQTINFDTVKKYILKMNTVNPPEPIMANCTNFIRDRDSTVRIVKRKKTWRVVINKRRIVGNRTVPYGYKICGNDEIVALD
jgi:hypothetical protein